MPLRYPAVTGPRNEAFVGCNRSSYPAAALEKARASLSGVSYSNDRLTNILGASSGIRLKRRKTAV